MSTVSEYNLSLQGLKGIVALVVFFSHALLMFRSTLISEIQHSPWHLFFDGECAVMIFFSISGFFYYNKKTFSSDIYIKGLWKKVKRIYPAYIISMIVAFIMCNMMFNYNKNLFTEWSNAFWQTPVSFSELIRQLPVLIPSNTNILNPPIWYMPIEVRMFIVMPLIMGFMNKCKIIKNKIWVWVVFLGLSFFIYSYLCYYLIGLLCHMAIQNVEKIRLLLKNKYIAITFVIIGVFVINIKNFSFIRSSSISILIQAFGSIMIIVAVYVNSYKCLSTRLAVWCGKISYELYLIHFVVLLSMRGVFNTPWLFVPVSLVISLISAYAIHLTVNKIIR